MRIEWLKFINSVPARIKKKSLGSVPFLGGRGGRSSNYVKAAPEWIKKKASQNKATRKAQEDLEIHPKDPTLSKSNEKL